MGIPYKLQQTRMNQPQFRRTYFLLKNNQELYTHSLKPQRDYRYPKWDETKYRRELYVLTYLIRPISKEGIKRWLIHHHKPPQYVFYFATVQKKVSIEQLKNRKALALYCYNLLGYTAEWDCMCFDLRFIMRSKGSWYGVSPYTFGRLIISKTDSPHKFRTEMFLRKRIMSRWFWADTESPEAVFDTELDTLTGEPLDKPKREGERLDWKVGSMKKHKDFEGEEDWVVEELQGRKFQPEGESEGFGFGDDSNDSGDAMNEYL